MRADHRNLLILIKNNRNQSLRLLRPLLCADSIASIFLQIDVKVMYPIYPRVSWSKPVRPKDQLGALCVLAKLFWRKTRRFNW